MDTNSGRSRGKATISTSLLEHDGSRPNYRTYDNAGNEGRTHDGNEDTDTDKDIQNVDHTNNSKAVEEESALKSLAILRSIRWMPYCLLCVFTTSLWLMSHGLIGEAPVFVQFLPEGEAVVTYAIVMGQLGIIVPAIYLTIRKLCKGRLKVWTVVVWILFMSATMALVEAFLWDWTATIAGAKHSVILFSLFFLMAGVDATATVAYPQYMTSFKPQYISSLYIGDATSAFLTGVLGLVQGIGGTKCANQTVIIPNGTYSNHTEDVIVPITTPPSFSVTTYFLVLFSIICICTIAFGCVHFSDYFTDARLENVSESHDDQKDSLIRSVDAADTMIDKDAHKANLASSIVTVRFNPLSKSKRNLMFFNVFWYSALVKTIHFSINVYSCQAYGDNAYSLSTRGSFIIRPLAVGLVLFLRIRSMLAIAVTVLVYTAMEAYLFYLAVANPDPPLENTTIGEILAVGLSIAAVGVSGYLNVCVVWELREKGSNTAMLWVGAWTLFGSIAGAILCLILIVVLDTFQSVDPCANYVF